MTDWLSEVEDTAWCEQKGDAMLMVGRMARVLRELAKMVKIFHNLSSVPQIDLQKAVDLSDDAKELLK